MALQISYNSDYGHTFATAYVRIQQVLIQTPLDNTNNRLNVTCEVYADSTARTNSKTPVGYLSVEGSFDEATTSTSRADLYAWLKTQPGFEGATDV